jgi:glycerol-3-phosphate O-acyltransferase / dihydroxyacetone phosphate acyltransferase
VRSTGAKLVSPLRDYLDALVARGLKAPVPCIIDGHAGLRRAGELMGPAAAVHRAPQPGASNGSSLPAHQGRPLRGAGDRLNPPRVPGPTEPPAPEQQLVGVHQLGRVVDRMDWFYSAVWLVVRFWLWFFFKPVDVRHPERVPAGGPVLLCINHPNNLIDSLVVGAALRRKVHYLAAAALFRKPLAARFLRACGAIPVYRKGDDPDKMDPNGKAFAACFEALKGGRLIAIYPEGTTHAEAGVQRIKSGAARIALGHEAARPGELSLVAVGLTFEARKSFLGRVLVSFGEPIPVAPYFEAYRGDSHKAVAALTLAIQRAMEAELVHLERIEATELVRAVEELYRGELISELLATRGLGAWQIDPCRLSRAIVDAVNYFKARDPERVERLWQRIQSYRALLDEYHVKDEAVQARRRRPLRRERVRHSWEAILGFPFFVYGAVVNGLPYLIPRWLARRLARKETDYATVRFLTSVVAFPLFWMLETWVVGRLTGAAGAAIFALSLPLSGLIAYRYLVGASRLRSRLRLSVLAFTREQAARCLVAEREAIIAELERAKADYLAPNVSSLDDARRLAEMSTL